LTPVLVGALFLATAGTLYLHYSGSYRTPSDAGVVPPPSFGSVGSTGQGSSGSTSAPGKSSARSTHPAKQHHKIFRPSHPAAPTRLRIATIDVDAQVVPVEVSTGGSLGVPDDPDTLGWWSGGARPGSRTGSVVIDGHVDSASQGIGAFFHLEKAPIGAIVNVGTSAGTMTYEIVGRRVYKKHALPSEVFSQKGPGRLVLITCGGPFDRATGSYEDNVVVYAVPAS
jgi:hypothetical protein